MDNQKHARTLYSSMAIPSFVHSYSIGVEYIYKWFLDKFNKTFFKRIHIEGKQILDDFRNFNIDSAIKSDKPSLSIIPQLQFDYDRDKIDSYPYGINQYIRRSKLETSFFKDKEKNLYIGIGLEEMLINFTFRVRLSTRAQQIDIYKFMNMAYRIGYTQGKYVDMDIHIPYSIMLQVAQDAGFKITDNDEILNILGFVSYLNSHTVIPVLYKYRTINGKNEFFLRFQEMYMHIACPDPLSADDGERTGMLTDNFMIDMNIQLKIPSPKMFIYYSETEHNKIINIETDPNATGAGLWNIKIPTVPDTNSKDWPILLSTEFYEDNINKQAVIDFNELFNGDNDIHALLNQCILTKISPSIFLDFKIYNNGEEIEYIMDWETVVMTTKNNIIANVISIYIYVDLKYMNEQLINIDKLNKDRLR